MGLVLTVTAGLVIWIVLWALGAKGFDSFMLAMLVTSHRVRARWAGTGVLAALALLPALAGCGGVSSSTAAENVGNQLTIYSSLPLQGPEGSISQQIVDGEKLALSDAQGHIGRFTVSYVSLDDSNATTGEWDPGVTASNAKAA